MQYKSATQECRNIASQPGQQIFTVLLLNKK